MPRFACAEFFTHRNLVAVIIFLSETLYSSMCSALHERTLNGKRAQYLFSHHTHKDVPSLCAFLFLPQKEVYENLHTAMLAATGLKNCTSLYSFSTRVCFANSQDLRLFRIRAGDIRRKRLASGASPRRRFPRRVWLLLPSVADYPALSNVRRKTVCSQCGKERGVENRTSVYDFQHEF